MSAETRDNVIYCCSNCQTGMRCCTMLRERLCHSERSKQADTHRQCVDRKASSGRQWHHLLIWYIYCLHDHPTNHVQSCSHSGCSRITRSSSDCAKSCLCKKKTKHKSSILQKKKTWSFCSCGPGHFWTMPSAECSAAIRKTVNLVSIIFRRDCTIL